MCICGGGLGGGVLTVFTPYMTRFTHCPPPPTLNSIKLYIYTQIVRNFYFIYNTNKNLFFDNLNIFLEKKLFHF